MGWSRIRRGLASQARDAEISLDSYELDGAASGSVDARYVRRALGQSPEPGQEHCGIDVGPEDDSLSAPSPRERWGGGVER